MLNLFVCILLRWLLSLRYRVQVRGLDAVGNKGKQGILFLPNHPALVEPLLLLVQLYQTFRPRVLADVEEVERPLISILARRLRVLRLPSLRRAGAGATDEVRQAMDLCVTALRDGDNLVLYPAGRIYRSAQEQIGANSAVERIVRAYPEVRVVLVRTSGLWGSQLSWAGGKRPVVAPALRRAVKLILANGLFFGPRRAVTIELVEAKDLPRTGGRREINTYLETFYNRVSQPNTYVPYGWWERDGVRVLPEPERGTGQMGIVSVSERVRLQVWEHLRTETGVAEIQGHMSLTRDLGVDSLTAVELLVWLESEYGQSDLDIEGLRTVDDVVLAAAGQAVWAGEMEQIKAPSRWFRKAPWPYRMKNLTERYLTDVFLEQAQSHPRRVVVADRISGVKTYRDMLLAIGLLRRELAQMPGDYVGIMLPASVGVTILYLATLFAGKIPVMVNWTLGRRHLEHMLETLEVQQIVTSQALLVRLQGQGVHLGEALEKRFFCVEVLRQRFGWFTQLKAWLSLPWLAGTLAHVKPPETAVVLFTSGSENKPKAVPLTHRQILTNITDACSCLTISDQDSLLAILPPFHSFGLTVSMLLPVMMGVRVFFYPNPTHGGVLGQLIDAYQLTFLVGTPSFLQGIVSVTARERLQSLRLVVSGAEKCSEAVYRLLAERCPYTKVLEGYGTTECAPVISVSRQWQVRPGTIGKVLPSVEYALVTPERERRVGLDEAGLLLVRGDSVFAGYLNNETASPFVNFEGQSWYNTGDLVSVDAEGVLTFRGRLKRFIKRGGEMISLPAIESVLRSHLAMELDEGPSLAVVTSDAEEHPDIVLFCIAETDRATVNEYLREGGLSGLHNIRQVFRVDSIPLLGTGKVDYRALAAQLTPDE